MARFNWLTKRITPAGRRRLHRERLVANRRAQEQGLFAIDSRTADLWTRRTRAMKTDEAADAFEQMKVAGKEVGSRIAQIRRELSNPNVSRADRARLQRELNQLQAMGKQIGQNRRLYRDVMEGRRSHSVELSAAERLMNKGRAIGHYYFGGTPQQTMARVGATVGGIVGLNVGLDALDNAISNMGSSDDTAMY